jgi:hypothetical protein
MVDWTKRIGRRIKLHDLHILLILLSQKAAADPN